LKDSFALIREAGLGSIDQVRISGGGAKSRLWRQILADVLDVELVTVNTTEGAAFGAALLAGVGAGLYSSVPEACQQMISLIGSTKPSGAQSIYEDVYPQYRALYPALADQFRKLAEIGSDQPSRSSAG
jgi:xylulokinase